MNDALSKVVIFTAGAIIGSVVTWKCVKSKYEQIAQEEIDSVKEVFARRREAEADAQEESKEAESFKTSFTNVKPDLKEYASKLMDMQYADEVAADEEDDDMYVTRIIEPEEYGELTDMGYDTDILSYFADGVVADDFDNVIDGVDLLGPEFIEIFENTDEDVVFVRNEDLKCDYEITRDLRKFSDVVGSDPQDAEDE